MAGSPCQALQQETTWERCGGACARPPLHGSGRCGACRGKRRQGRDVWVRCCGKCSRGAVGKGSRGSAPDPRAHPPHLPPGLLLRER